MAKKGILSVKVDTGRTTERLNLIRNLNPRPDLAYNAIRDVLRKRVMLRFAQKKDPSGRRWAPWAASTAAARKKVGGVAYKPGPVSLLEYTGAQKRSFFAETRRGVMRIGFRVPYARIHETGRKASAKHPGMPARRVITDGKGQLPQGDRIAAGMVLRNAVIKSVTRYLDK